MNYGTIGTRPKNPAALAHIAKQEAKRAHMRRIVRQPPCAGCGSTRWRADVDAVCVGCRLPRAVDYSSDLAQTPANESVAE